MEQARDDALAAKARDADAAAAVERDRRDKLESALRSAREDLAATAAAHGDARVSLQVVTGQLREVETQLAAQRAAAAAADAKIGKASSVARSASSNVDRLLDEARFALAKMRIHERALRNPTTRELDGSCSGLVDDDVTI